MIFAYRSLETVFFENQVSIVKKFFFQNNFLIFSNHRAYQIAHKNLVFGH
jgi:hypothetical protein